MANDSCVAPFWHRANFQDDKVWVSQQKPQRMTAVSPKKLDSEKGVMRWATKNIGHKILFQTKPGWDQASSPLFACHCSNFVCGCMLNSMCVFCEQHGSTSWLGPSRNFHFQRQISGIQIVKPGHQIKICGDQPKLWSSPGLAIANKQGFPSKFTNIESFDRAWAMSMKSSGDLGGSNPTAQAFALVSVDSEDRLSNDDVVCTTLVFCNNIVKY